MLYSNITINFVKKHPSIQSIDKSFTQILSLLDVQSYQVSSSTG